MEFLTLKKIFLYHLQEIYSGEKHLFQNLPSLIRSVNNKNLEMILRECLEISKVHLSRIEEMGLIMTGDPGGENCNAIEGLLEEAEDMVEENDQGDLIDLTMIALLQKIKHFLIAGYGTLLTYARSLGEERMIYVIKASLEDEREINYKLEKLSAEMIEMYGRVGRITVVS
jgi:ferritin-like metal-binding protein YciE